MENNTKDYIGRLRSEAVVEKFYENLRLLRKKDPEITLKEVIERTVRSAAPRFFVGFENARRFISLLMRNKQLPIKNKNKIAMYKEIYRRYKERLKKEMCNYTVLESIIEEPAPSFYIDDNRFRCILYNEINRKRKLFANKKLCSQPSMVCAL